MMWSLVSVVVTGAILLFALASIFDLRRRIRIVRNREKLIPIACRVPGLREEVQRLESHRQQLAQEGEEVKSLLFRRKSAEQWLQANEVIYEKASRELPALKAQIELAEHERDTYFAQREQAEIDCQAIRAEHLQLQQQIAPLRHSFDRKREIEEWLTENEPRFQRLQAELEPMQANVAALQSERTRLEDTNSSLLAEGLQAKAQRDWLQAENARLNAVIESQNAECRQLEDESAGLHARKTGLMAEIEQLLAKKSGLESESGSLGTKLAFVRSEMKKVEEELKELDVDRAGRLADVQALSRLKKELLEEKAQIEDRIKQSKARLEAELDQINQLIKAAVERWQQVAPTVGASDENRLKELWTPVLSKAQFAAPAQGTEGDHLEETARYLDDLGLRFDRRVLNAFHTSLKVSETSPLVVLAGISGTGKSELPRRYAEGMGMHSLTLAVQPRWDSPQDMFGFYNYLENRYRATELARALVQMDRYYDEFGRGWNYPDGWDEHSLRERMLLVLLDEMNLARVEYYFSEFLSRLETRRGVNRDNPLERRKAEILLEVGMQLGSTGKSKSVQIQQPTLPLFVDTNVLFVGTMNEDESTQTLSDKVVDRANVLRFGRPARLESAATGSRAAPRQNWLGYDHWKGWIRNEECLSSEVRDAVFGWGQTLNEAFQRIGRPFAHRTFASMVAYVANYPQPDSYRHAMADQIELKLLPKLRGLDPQEAAVRQTLAKLQDVLKELDDQKLLEAVRQAAQRSEHQFIWNGVDRLEHQ